MKILTFIFTLLSFASFGQSKNIDIIKNFPHIPDSVQLIRTIIEYYDLEVDSLSVKEYLTASFITRYEKIEISGSEDSIIILEYDYGDGCAAAFPFKYQLFFKLDGQLIDITQFEQIEQITIFPKDKPFLKGLTVTSKGNGNFGVYKIRNDKLVNLIEKPNGYYSRTFDAHTDEDINVPHGLNLILRDVNNDGLIDLIYIGEKHWTLYQFKFTDKIEYIYLYNRETGKFKEKENYHDLFVKRRDEEINKLKK